MLGYFIEVFDNCEGQIFSIIFFVLEQEMRTFQLVSYVKFVCYVTNVFWADIIMIIKQMKRNSFADNAFLC